MSPSNKFLFNFSASWSGGGYKRLYEYARWFNGNGGAWFVVHQASQGLIAEFPNNQFFVVRQSRLKRIFNDWDYLKAIEAEIGRPALYYSYGIPVYFRLGRINWFHLSNVLPLNPRAAPLSFFDRRKLGFLGSRIRRGYRNADVISAESRYSLSLIKVDRPRVLFLSVNGSDDEIAALRTGRNELKENIATVVGTFRHKGLGDSLRVFEMLRKANAGLQLTIIGNPEWVPPALRGRPDVILRGTLGRPEVIDYLRRSRYYIATTHIENSYNAASEGAFLTDESYISDIGPHRELLANSYYEEVRIPGVRRGLLHVNRKDLRCANLKSWGDVVTDMITRFGEDHG